MRGKRHRVVLSQIWKPETRFMEMDRKNYKLILTNNATVGEKKKKINTRFIKLDNCDAAALRLRRWCEFYFYKEDSRRYFSQVKICDYVIAVAQINTQTHTHTYIYTNANVFDRILQALIYFTYQLYFFIGRAGAEYSTNLHTHTGAHIHICAE